MIFTTRNAAVRSLREFSPALRAAHMIVRFYSQQDQAYRYTRVLVARRLA
jgi:hypothetical protein